MNRTFCFLANLTDMKYTIDVVIKRLQSKVREVFTIKKVKRIFMITREKI